MALDRFQAFARRLDRRLQEMQAGAGEAFLGIEKRMVNSDARHRAHLAELQRQVILATNFALSEAERLPGDPELREDAPTIKAKLDDYAAGLFRMKWFFEIPVTLANAADASVHQMIAGDVEDYEARVWHERNVGDLASLVDQPAAFGGSRQFNAAPFNTAAYNSPGF